MPVLLRDIISIYVSGIMNIYGPHLKQVILFGSYARGDFGNESDIDIMILLDISDEELKRYRKQLSAYTFDFNMEYDLDIKPIVKSEALFNKWVQNYPFYNNIQREGVKLYGTA